MDSVDISLRAWIATGRFGAIQLGDTRSDVAAVFGAPTLWSTPAKTPDRAPIWKYGDIEFYFQDDNLWMIFADDFAVPRGNAQIELDAWIISGKLTLNAMERHLIRASIGYRKEIFPYSENGFRLITTGATVLSFSGPDARSPRLHAIFCQI